MHNGRVEQRKTSNRRPIMLKNENNSNIDVVSVGMVGVGLVLDINGSGGASWREGEAPKGPQVTICQCLLMVNIKVSLTFKYFIRLEKSGCAYMNGNCMKTHSATNGNYGR